MPRSHNDPSVLPDRFEVAFRELGRVGCEAHFGAGRKMITAWLELAGKERLLEERRIFIKAKRTNDRDRELRELPRRPSAQLVEDERPINPKLADIACRFLQSREGGRWVCYRCDDNPAHFMVGVLRLSAGQMLDKAKARGFNEARALHQIRVFAEGEKG